MHTSVGGSCSVAHLFEAFLMLMWRMGLQIEGYLEEMLLLCQHSEEYNQFMLAKLTGAAAGMGSPKADTAALENGFRSGQFNVTVRELIAYYINLVRGCQA